MIKFISEIKSSINISAFNNNTQRVLTLIEMLSGGARSPKYLASSLRISLGHIYKLKDQANDLMWDYQVVSDKDLFYIEKVS